MATDTTKKVIVDIDGTIAKVGERIKYLKQSPKDWDSFYNACFDDEPIQAIVDLVNKLSWEYDIVFCTGRRESIRWQTAQWLNEHFGESAAFYYRSDDLLMRPDKDHRHDTEVKPELLARAGLTTDNVAFILEDRNSMVKRWREIGFTCLQVAEGDF